MSVTAEQADPRDTRFLLLTFSAGHMANDWAPGAMWLIAPAVSLDMGLSPSQLGLLLRASVHRNRWKVSKSCKPASPFVPLTALQSLLCIMDLAAVVVVAGCSPDAKVLQCLAHLRG